MPHLEMALQRSYCGFRQSFQELAAQRCKRVVCSYKSVNRRSTDVEHSGIEFAGTQRVRPSSQLRPLGLHTHASACLTGGFLGDLDSKKDPAMRFLHLVKSQANSQWGV